MRLSIRRGFSAVPENIECSFAELVAFFRANAALKYTRKEDLLHVVFAETRGSFKAADLGPLWAIALDYDDVPAAAFERAVEVIKQAAPSGGIAHTTWGFCASEKPGVTHDGSSVRGRIIVPLDEPIPVGYELATIVAFAASIEARSGCAADPETLKTHARFWYAPGTNAHAPAWAQPCWFEAWGV